MPLLGNITSPTTAVPYGSMTSELRVLSTEKHWPVRRQHTMYTNKSSECKVEVHKQEFTVQGGSTQFASEQVGRLRCGTAVDGGIEAFPFSIMICAPMI